MLVCDREGSVFIKFLWKTKLEYDTILFPAMIFALSNLCKEKIRDKELVEVICFEVILRVKIIILTM